MFFLVDKKNTSFTGAVLLSSSSDFFVNIREFLIQKNDASDI